MPVLHRINNFTGNLILTKHFCSLLLLLPFFLVINVNLRRYFSNFMLMLFGRFCILKSISISMYLKLLIRVLLIRFHIVQKWKWKVENRANSTSLEGTSPMLKQETIFFFHNWTSEIIPFIRFGMQMDRT